MKQLEITKELFQDLYPYIVNEKVTDIKWNGYELRIDDLDKGRYVSDKVLDDDFLNIFTSRLSNHVNVGFNPSRPTLQAETPGLRIQASHPFVHGDGKYVLAIRKTPAVARLSDAEIKRQGYADDLFPKLMKGLIKAHMAGIIIGDVGAGKTELEKYIAGFIPDDEPTVTIEDTLELKLKQIYPKKDIFPLKVTEKFPTEQAIRHALRTNTKWMLIAEARGREIFSILEGASTGCIAWSTIHTTNVWKIPDRIVQMAGGNADKEALENTVYEFFNVGIKVSKTVTSNGIKRRIEEICFFDRKDGKNNCVVFMKKGKYTGMKIPESIMEELRYNKEDELLSMLDDLYSSFDLEEKEVV